ncbi:MAG: GNAT family N-acetyltransferase [Candidatus Eremiobacterota bacterium]
MSAALLSRFLKLPYKLYRGDPDWVAPLLSDQRSLLDPAGPFMKHAEGCLFLVEGRGRLAAFVNRAMGDPEVGCVGFFECQDDRSVAADLFGRAEEWLAGLGVRRVLGPLSPSLNETVGLLVEGEPGPPTVMMAYNPTFYPRLFEACGYAKGRDFVAYRLPLPAPRLAFPRDLAVRTFRMERLAREAERFAALHNRCYRDSGHYAFAALSAEEARHMASSLRFLLDPECTVMVEQDGGLVAGLLAVPDVNPLLRAFRGRMGPLELARLLWNRRRMGGLRIMDVNVAPELTGRGIARAMVSRVLERAGRYGRIEYSWVAEDNLPSHRVALAFGGRVTRRYRVYEKRL